MCDEHIAIQQDHRLRTLSRCAARSSGLRRMKVSSPSTPKDSSIAARSFSTSLEVALMLRSRNRRTSSAREILCARANSSSVSACSASSYKFVRFIHHNTHQLRLVAVHREKSAQPAGPACAGGFAILFKSQSVVDPPPACRVRRQRPAVAQRASQQAARAVVCRVRPQLTTLR